MNDIDMLKKALDLEREAMNRYIKHISAIRDPRVNAVLEGFRRNETGHKGEIEELMSRLEKKR
jgi:rubrerythrin